MRTIVHLSDLHFGTEDRQVVDAVVSAVHQAAPDLVAVSGDLTQRARRHQFLAARAFLQRLPHPQLVVPGNHDVPLYNVVARFAAPLAGFQRYIARDLCPVHRDTELMVVGVNTTRAFTIKDGGLRPRDVHRIVAAIDETDEDTLKVVVCHHPFDTPTSRSGRMTRPRVAADAINALVGAGTDILLTGHLHVSYTGASAVRYRVPGRAAIIVEAGTAASTRVRGEVNSFNVLRAARDVVAVQRLAWDADVRAFSHREPQIFRRDAGGWAEEQG
jgi:predicted phosphodiesterase